MWRDSRNETTSDIGLRYTPSVPSDGNPIAITRGVMYVRSRLNPSSMNRRFSFETRPRIIPVIFTRDAVFFPASSGGGAAPPDAVTAPSPPSIDFGSSRPAYCACAACSARGVLTTASSSAAAAAAAPPTSRAAMPAPASESRTASSSASSSSMSTNARSISASSADGVSSDTDPDGARCDVRGVAPDESAHTSRSIEAQCSVCSSSIVRNEKERSKVIRVKTRVAGVCVTRT